MSVTAAKVLIMAAKDKRVRNAIISVVIGSLLFLILCLSMCSAMLGGRSSALAEQALAEYNYWQKATPSTAGYSCQGERYCSHFSSPVVDWCCYFVGFCAENAGFNLEEIGFSPNTNSWTKKLDNNNKLKSAGEYSPQMGNLVFFNYNGRTNYRVTHNVSHVGIIVGVSTDTVTVVAGNEYRGETSNWANVSYVNKYTLSINDDTIACYGAVGSDSTVTENSLNGMTRNIICHNEVGIMYSDVSSEYGSVIANDNGALSIGVYGWHGNNALSLLKRAYDINPMEVNAVITPYYSSGLVLSAIRGSADWSSYIPDVDTCACIKAIILSNAGKSAQDETSLEDSQNYIDICQNHGLTDYKVIVYCSDILNQWGTSSFELNIYGQGINGVLYGVDNSMSLDDIYSSGRAWNDSQYDYKSRRTWTYEYLKNATIQ